MTATVDIIVRTKDRPLFLERALRSIKSQTFSDWRAIIVNDGGDPEAFDEVIGRSELGESLVTVHHELNRGMVPSANRGLAEGGAEFVVLHDDDDTWHPDFLERGVAYLQANVDAPGVVGRIDIVWESFEGEELVEQSRERFQPQLTAPFLSDLLLFNRFVPIGFLYRRAIHEVIGNYREDLPVVDDWDFHRRILVRWPLEYLGDDTLAFWHQRPGVDGIEGNSVIVKEREHRHFDARVRDDLLREYVHREGDGHLLYLTKFIDQRVSDLEHHVDSLAHADRQHLRDEVESLRQELRTNQNEILRSFERSRSLSSRISGVWRRLSGHSRA